MENKLIKNLQNKRIFPHEVKYFKVIETHISWVLLTGDFAYKIKKPVDFEFLDFTTLEKRKYFCEKELELNQLLTPEIYLEVIPITNTLDEPQLNGSGPVIEYALKMREFSQEHLFNRLLKDGKLTLNHIDDFAHILADFHNKTSTKSPAYLGTPEQVYEPIVQNFDQIKSLLTDADDIKKINVLEDWSEKEYKRLYETLKHRKENGFIRECHGDVHLGNITLYDNKPVLFDCIEFNEPFRWTDVMADLGFLVMDLDDHEKPDFASQLINTYLMVTGDYNALKILPFYQVYRAMVRAKITLFERAQIKDDEKKSEALTYQYRRFVNLAELYMKKTSPRLMIMHGLSASGKSTIAKQIAKQTRAIHIRSDIERKRLSGLDLFAQLYSKVNVGLYSPKMTEKTYQKLSELTEIILSAGYHVIVDSSFLKRKYRELFYEIAKKHTCPFIIISCETPLEKILEWINEREKKTKRISEAYKAVVLMQNETQEILDKHEKNYQVSVEPSKTIDIKKLVENILSKL